jgi:hypothetical protein
MKEEKYFTDGKFDFQKYRDINKDKINERMKTYRETNKEIINEKNKLHYQNNKEAINAKRREEYAKKKSMLYDAPKATAFS